MGFEFTEPTNTVVPDEVKEEVVDVVPDSGSDSGGDGIPSDDTVKPDEDAGGEAAGGDAEPPASTPEPTETPSEEVAFFYGDDQVELEIDPSHREAFTEKGLDIDKLAAELYGQGGEFKLSDESYKACCDAFGKFAIDAFLSGLKAQADGAVSGWKQAEADKVRADEALYTKLTADIGGDEGWTRLEEYAQATLTDEEFLAFNEVMASGNQYLQTYAIREMEQRRKGAQGDDSVTLIEGDASRSGNADNSPLNGRDYIKATAELGRQFPHDKAGYAKAQAALDARRRAGLSAGL